MNNLQKFLIAEIKKSDKYKIYKSEIGRFTARDVKIVYISTSTVQIEPYCEYVDFTIVVKNRLEFTFKIYTNGDYKIS